MHPKNIIHDELLQFDAAVLIPLRQLPYALHPEYFNNFPEHIVGIVKEVNSPEIIFNSSKENPFSIPDNYFENLASEVQLQIKAADQIIQSSELGYNNSKQMPYEIPLGYFDTLLANVLDEVNDINSTPNDELNNLSPLLAFLKTEQPYAVPDGYFKSLPREILSTVVEDKISAEKEISNLSPLLASLKGSAPYEVPTHYFDASSTARHIMKDEDDKADKNLHFKRRRDVKWTSAIAATVILLLSVTGWKFFVSHHQGVSQPSVAATSQTDFNKQMAQIPDAEIQNYIENNLDEFDENSLANALNDEKKTLDTKTLLNGISNEQIENYLQSDL